LPVACKTELKCILNQSDSSPEVEKTTFDLKIPRYARARNYSFSDLVAACVALDEQDRYEWLFNHNLFVGKHSISMSFPPGSPAAKPIPPDTEARLTIFMKGHDERMWHF
jgi:hypothetical protein